MLESMVIDGFEVPERRGWHRRPRRRAARAGRAGRPGAFARSTTCSRRAPSASSSACWSIARRARRCCRRSSSRCGNPPAASLRIGDREDRGFSRSPTGGPSIGCARRRRAPIATCGSGIRDTEVAHDGVAEEVELRIEGERVAAALSQPPRGPARSHHPRVLRGLQSERDRGPGRRAAGHGQDQDAGRPVPIEARDGGDDMNEQEFAELAAGYALDALSPEDRSAFETARAQHPEWERAGDGGCRGRRAHSRTPSPRCSLRPPCATRCSPGSQSRRRTPPGDRRGASRTCGAAPAEVIADPSRAAGREPRPAVAAAAPSREAPTRPPRTRPRSRRSPDAAGRAGARARGIPRPARRPSASGP